MKLEDKIERDIKTLRVKTIYYRPRVTPRGVRQIMDAVEEIMSDMTQGHEGEFVPISVKSVQSRLRQDRNIFLTYRQTGYYMLRVVDEDIFEKETHHTDKAVRRWTGQYSRYKLIQRSPKPRFYSLPPELGPDLDRQDLGNGSYIPI
jgi:hypothetical protein